jgi:hypothetical protein
VTVRLAFAALVLSVWLAPQLASAQKARVSMSASSSRVTVGEPFGLEVRAEIEGGEADDVTLPDFGTLEVLGRRVSRPFSFSFGFGSSGQHAVAKSELVYSFTLRAVQPGTYRLAGAVVVMGRRKFTSAPLTIEATGSPVPPQGSMMPPGLSPQQQEPADLTAPPDGPLEGAKYDATTFVRTVVDKKQAYVGEQVTVTVYLYTRGSLHQSPTLTREPTTEGFWVQDLLPTQRSLTATRQDVNGRTFQVYVLRRFAAFPLRAGALKIGAPSVELGSSGSLFDLLNGPSAPTRRNGVDVGVEALALPERKNAQHPAHVGSLSLTSELDPPTARMGDAVTLRVIARGTGNLKALELATPVVEGAEVLAPEIDDKLTTDADRVGGERTYRWLILPRREGELAVPGFSVDVLDAENKSYDTITAAARTLKVSGGQAPAAATAPTPSATAGAGADPDEKPHFGPVRTESALARRAPGLHQRAWYGFVLGAAPLALCLLVLTRLGSRSLRKRRESSSGARRFREAQDKLDEARAAAERADAQAALGAVAAGLKRGLESRLEEPVGGYTREALRRHLGQRGMPAPLTDRLLTQLETCELARFDPAEKSRAELTTEVEKARGVLRELERFVPQQVQR